ncbi:MAG: glycosyltransferase family 4 protein [Candidatus Binatia bacterium]
MHETPSTGFQHTAATQRYICFVTETYLPEVNGVALTLAHLVKGLRAQGHEVSLVHPYRRTSERLGGGCDTQVTFVRGLPLPGYKGLQFGLPASGLLRRSWTQHRPDVVYVATEGPLGWSAVRAARRLGIPIFSGFHTNFHSYSRYYRASWSQNAIFRYLRRFHNRTTGTLVPNVDLRDRLQAFGFNNVSVLGRGVDSQLFTPERRCAALRRQWGAADNDLVVLYVGRVAPEKNLGLALEAYRTMQRCSDSVKCVVVGEGPLSVALQKEQTDLIFCGVHTGAQLAKHYASADAFLFPSETETFGNVTLEAMASGLVVVAYDYAAAKMHITHGETGMLAPYGDAKAFVDLAAKLAREPQSFHKIRQQAREYVISIDWRRIVESFAALLTGVYGQSRVAPDTSRICRSVAT